MTPELCAAIVNRSCAIAREVAALHRQTPESLARLQAAIVAYGFPP